MQSPSHAPTSGLPTLLIDPHSQPSDPFLSPTKIIKYGRLVHCIACSSLIAPVTPSLDNPGILVSSSLSNTQNKSFLSSTWFYLPFAVFLIPLHLKCERPTKPV